MTCSLRKAYISTYTLIYKIRVGGVSIKTPLLIENCNYTGVLVVKTQHFASLLRKNDRVVGDWNLNKPALKHRKVR